LNFSEWRRNASPIGVMDDKALSAADVVWFEFPESPTGDRWRGDPRAEPADRPRLVTTMARARFQRRYLLATWTCRPSDTIQIHRSHEQWLTCCGDVAAFLEAAGRAEISVRYPQIEGAPMMYVVHELEIQRRETLDVMRAPVRKST
jgi:hypothetical protein